MKCSRRSAKKTKHAVSRGVVIPGVDNVLIHLASCCTPVLGDEIIGYVTQGKGVSVHRLECKNIQRFVAENYHTLDVKWEKGFNGTYISRVDVIAGNPANINKVSAEVLLALTDMNMELVSVVPEKSNGTVHVSLNTKNKDQLMAFVNKVRSRPGVKDAYRR